MPNWDYYDRDSDGREERASGLFESLEGSDREGRAPRRGSSSRSYERSSGRDDRRRGEPIGRSYDDYAGSGNVTLYAPKSFADVQAIIESLARKESVIVNLEAVEIESAQRILDFLSGASYALGGSMRRIKAYTFLITPQGTGITDTDDGYSR